MGTESFILQVVANIIGYTIGSIIAGRVVSWIKADDRVKCSQEDNNGKTAF